jgi:hypothetical protein
MPRVLVVTDGPDREVVMSEHVVPQHLHSAHGRGQLVERLAWGIDDAVRAETGSEESDGDGALATSYLEVGA